MENNAKQRVSIYVDGFNFYFGLKSRGWKKYYWLDIVKFFENFIKPHQELVQVTYFSAIPLNKDKHDRQDLFFSANRLNPKFKVELGKYLPKTKTCRNCNSKHVSYEEKETDVKIAIKMISDVIYDVCDITILVSADSDLVPPIDFIRSYKSGHKIFIYFPPNRFSSNLNAFANKTKKLDGATVEFSNSILPDNIKLPNGFILKRPNKWV